MVHQSAAMPLTSCQASFTSASSRADRACLERAWRSQPANGRLRDAEGACQLYLRGALQRAYAGRCRFRKVRARLMVRAFSSGGSFQGNTVISAFGASEAMSIETWSGCAVTSSGSTSIGVWHDFAKSRDTLYTKSGRVR